MKADLTGWHKSSYSGQQGGCIEVGHAPGVVGLRDTKNRDGGTLIFSHEVFGALLTLIKADRIG